MKTLRRIPLVALALVLAGSQLALAADLPDLAGRYECHGQDVDGTAYQGTCNILKSGDAYVLAWEVVYPAKSPKSMFYTGVGIQTPTGLAASFGGGPKPSVIAYERGRDGALTGRWIIQGNRTLQPEKLVPINQ